MLSSVCEVAVNTGENERLSRERNFCSIEQKMKERKNTGVSKTKLNKYINANDDLGNIVSLLSTVLFGEKVPKKQDLNQHSCS